MIHAILSSYKGENSEISPHFPDEVHFTTAKSYLRRQFVA
jgi:hypothetical protein